jgi:hypothetical protein
MNLESRTLESSPGLAAISQQLRLTRLNIRSFPEVVSRFSGNRTEPINTMGFTTGFVSIFLQFSPSRPLTTKTIDRRHCPDILPLLHLPQPA